MTQQNDGDAKAIEREVWVYETDGRPNPAYVPDARGLALGAHPPLERYIPAAELEAVRLELERVSADFKATCDVGRRLEARHGAVCAELTTERARAEETERRLKVEESAHGHTMARAARLEEETRLLAWAAMHPGASADQLKPAWTVAERILSAAPQAPTEQVDHRKVGRNSWTLGTCAGCGGTNAALFDGPYCCKPCRRQHEETSPIPQVAQASAHVWQSDGTHSACARCGENDFLGKRGEAGACRGAQRSTLPWDQPEHVNPHAGSPLSSAYSAHEWAEVVAEARVRAFREELAAALRSVRDDVAHGWAGFEHVADRLESGK